MKPTDTAADLAGGHNTAFEARAAALRARVADAAQTLVERGIQPTVTRIRAALGGGSPNDLAPALRSWRETAWTDDFAAASKGGSPAGRIPPSIADLVHELWQRAFTTASLELKHGPTARQVTTRTAEVDSLRTQLSAVRQQLERESLAYGELRAQAARHETIARQALVRAEDAETRARDLLRELGGARQKMAQLSAELKQRRQPAHPARSIKGRDSTLHQQRAASTSKRVKRTARGRAAASVRPRPPAKKRPSYQSKKESRGAMGKPKHASGTGLARRGHR